MLLAALTTCGCAESDVATTLLAEGYGIPTALEVIGEDDFLFAERRGTLYRFEAGSVQTITGLPPVAVIENEGLIFGGLLDVSLHPNFADNRLVYLTYDNTDSVLELARFELAEGAAESFEVLRVFTEFSIGSRIAWQDDAHLFMSFGMGGSPYPDPGAQDLTLDVGKIHRLTADGQIPADNPVFEGAGGPTTIWSYGHRNPQGLFYDADTQSLYANEHGPKGGDELNTIVAGGNYGWPLFSYGLNYDDTPVSQLSEAEAAEFSILPTAYWSPDFRVAPSGLLLVQDSVFEAWTGSFLMGALRPQHLLRYDPATDTTEIVMSEVGRVRDVAQLPSGTLLIAIDAGSPKDRDSGRIFELSPR